MNVNLPKRISEAIAEGTWRDPGPDALRRALGQDLDLPDLELFEGTDTMSGVAEQVAEGGFVDDPEFCMVRNESALTPRDDDRLVLANAVFIAGSVMPGDDTFVVLDLGSSADDPNVLVLDWRKPVPHRWMIAGTLGHLIDSLSE